MNAISLVLHLARAMALSASASATPADQPAGRTFVIVTTPDLEPAAQEWAVYRQSHSGGGWQSVVHVAEPADNPQISRDKIRQFIRQAYHSAAPAANSEFAVLLLGDTDSASQSGIPTWYFAQDDSVLRSRDGSNDEYASDHPYQVIKDGADEPHIALGRIPARTLGEARTALKKIIRYEQMPAPSSLESAARARIAYTASEGRFGVFDDLLESLFKTMVDRMVPDAFDLSMIYAKPSSIYCPPPSRLTESVLAQLNAGALLFNYMGHGYPQGFDSLHWREQRFPILNVNHVEKMSSGSDGDVCLPIAFLSCCSAGWYDLPQGERSLAEALFFHTGGTIAVIAGSRITHPYPNTLMQMNITKSLLVDRTPTVGMLDLAATQAMLKRSATDRQIDSLAAPIARSGKWESSLADLRKMHVKIYNLIGDPATRIALPARPIQNFAVNQGVISGTIADMHSGRISITAETERTSMASPDRIQAPVGHGDSELETKAANNFTLVNDRVLARVQGEVIDGRFTVPLPEGWPSQAAVLRAYAIGTDDGQNVIDAAGAVRLK